MSGLSVRVDVAVCLQHAAGSFYFKKSVLGGRSPPETILAVDCYLYGCFGSVRYCYDVVSFYMKWSRG